MQLGNAEVNRILNAKGRIEWNRLFTIIKPEILSRLEADNPGRYFSHIILICGLIKLIILKFSKNQPI